jgi:hypothetical protein
MNVIQSILEKIYLATKSSPKKLNHFISGFPYPPPSPCRVVILSSAALKLPEASSAPPCEKRQVN